MQLYINNSQIRYILGCAFIISFYFPASSKADITICVKNAPPIITEEIITEIYNRIETLLDISIKYAHLNIEFVENKQALFPYFIKYGEAYTSELGMYLQSRETIVLYKPDFNIRILIHEMCHAIVCKKFDDLPIALHEAIAQNCDRIILKEMRLYD